VRRAALPAVALLAVYLLVRVLDFNASTGAFLRFDVGESFASWTGESSALPPARARDELRIDITWSAVQAESERNAIMARFSGDRAASRWVADCTEQGLSAGEDVVSGDLSAEIERFCWRQYASDHP
jgi:hypothetical protein